jgi:uncharacterized membrane protein
MRDHKQLLFTAITAALAVGAASFGNAAFAADADREQCAGVVKAGKNDCATSKNQCHGHVTVDAHPEACIYVPKGTCDRIAGGRIVKVAEPAPQKS